MNPTNEELPGKLFYVHDNHPGITRRPHKDTFEYFDPHNQKITKPETLERIRSLAIPPAYEKVWICPSPNGHLQATGRDAKGRKQYRYHPLFRETRDESKFERMSIFAEALPKIHERVNRDLAKRGFPKEKVVAAIVSLLEKSLIRVGNDEYRKTNKSYGLTTLRNRHVEVEGSELNFKFLGKSKVKHQITLKDARLAKLVRKLQDLPGQELFQFEDEAGTLHSVTSQDVNTYLHDVAGEPFSAKDFRTWAGTVLALSELVGEDEPTTKTQAKRTVNSAIKAVALQLGNTPSVCRKCYIHPAILDAYTTKTLSKYVAKCENADEMVVSLLKAGQRPPVRRAG